MTHYVILQQKCWILEPNDKFSGNRAVRGFRWNALLNAFIFFAFSLSLRWKNSISPLKLAAPRPSFPHVVSGNPCVFNMLDPR